MLLRMIFITVVVAAAADEVIKMDFDPSVFRRFTRAAGDIAACSNDALAEACSPTCRKTGFCVNSEFRETEDCGEGYCNSDNNGVSCGPTLTTCVPNKADIGCDTDGVFPDLYNCRNRITCTKGSVGEPSPVCENDLGYDECTGKCDVVLKTGCTPVAALCKRTGVIERLEFNNRLYYYCVKDADGLLHPVIGRCERGFFDAVSFTCKDAYVPGCLE